MTSISPAKRLYLSLLGRQEKKAQEITELGEQVTEDADLLAATLVDEAKVRLDAEKHRESDR